MSALTYNPAVFAVPDEDAARRIILTREADLDTDTRWASETPYLTQLIGEHLAPRPGQLLVDYGCGIGRLSKTVIEAYGCSVLGVDISPEMRALAPGYVQSQAFSAVSRGVFQRLIAGGLKVDAAFAVWVLQHCPNPGGDIGLLQGALAVGAPLFVVNNIYRAVPTVEKGWLNDGVDIRTALDAAFAPAATGNLDVASVGAQVAEGCYWSKHVRA